MVKGTSENHWGKNVLTFPDVPRQPLSQEERLKIEEEVMTLMQDLETETDQSQQRIIMDRSWRMVKTGKAD